VRRWRVGTLSLGVLLILLGIIMLAAQFKQAVIFDMLITWWPLILVLIGAEILVHVYTAKEPEPKVKYDGFSIFIIMVIVFFSIGIYAVTATGVLERISWMVQSSSFPVEIPAERIDMGENVEKIVISAPAGNLDIRKSGDGEVIHFGEAIVKAADTDEAKMLTERNRAVTHLEGNTLFVRFLSDTWPGDFKPGIREIRHTILLPTDLDVEIGGPTYFNLNIDGEALQRDWLIKGRGRINVTVNKGSDLVIDAQVGTSDWLGGNVNWEIEEITAYNENGTKGFKGYLRWGEGNSKVSIIIDGGEIQVSEI